MASIYLVNKFLSKVAPQLYKPAVATSEKIIGSLGKIAYESTLLNAEISLYTHGFGTVAIFSGFGTIVDQSAPPVITFAMSAALTGSLIAYGPMVGFTVPIARTSYTMYKRRINIINL